MVVGSGQRAAVMGWERVVCGRSPDLGSVLDRASAPGQDGITATEPTLRPAVLPHLWYPGFTTEADLACNALGLRSFLIVLGNAALTNHEFVSGLGLSHKPYID